MSWSMTNRGVVNASMAIENLEIEGWLRVQVAANENDGLRGLDMIFKGFVRSQI